MDAIADSPSRGLSTVGVLAGLAVLSLIAAGTVVFTNEDVLHVPIQAVHHEGSTHFVYVPIAGGCAQRSVTVGKGSDLYIEIASGLDEGDRVLLTEPRPEDIIERLDKPQSTDVDDAPLLAAEERAGDALDDAADAFDDADVLATPETSLPDVDKEFPDGGSPAEPPTESPGLPNGDSPGDD